MSAGRAPQDVLFGDSAVVARLGTRAARELGHTRLWSIHPAQIRPIVAAFRADEVDAAIAILDGAGVRLPYVGAAAGAP
jgi:citrate lyase beta subunit